MIWEEIKKARARLAREQGVIVKDWGGRLPLALIYPNTYYVGMSNLGLHTIYSLINRDPKLICERAFFDLDNRCPQSLQSPPISLESQRPLVDFAVLAFSMQYELDYCNAVQIIQRSGLPPLAVERDERHPIVIAGGPAVTANPQPLAPIFDAFVIGEAEPVLPGLLSALQEGIGDSRAALLRSLAALDGVYVPRYHGGQPVVRQWVRDIDAFATASAILTPDTELASTYLMEIERGCERGCAFCLAGRAYRPLRAHSLGNLLAQAEEGLKSTERLGLVGAAVLDHPQIEELVVTLGQRGATLSLSSLRIDALSETVVKALAQGGSKTITLAPEAGSERLRQRIKKGITEDGILKATALAARYGFRQIKLYFMVGLPTETDDDIQDIVRLVEACLESVEGQRAGSRLVLNVSPFVPKAGTPFERLPMAQPRDLEYRLANLRRQLRHKGVEIKSESPAWSQVQAELARGDERLAGVLINMGENTLAAWRRALQTCGVESGQFAHRLWRRDEVLPWSVVRL